MQAMASPLERESELGWKWVVEHRRPLHPQVLHQWALEAELGRE